MDDGVIKRNLLIKEMEEFFGADRKRINHAKTVLQYAESILEDEPGNAAVVVAAAVLHDIGIKEAERKYNSSAGKLQEVESPPIAREIMKKIGIENDVIEEVCDIIAHHHTPNAMNVLNFRIILDADLITNIIEEDIKINKRKIEKIFKTSKGREIARKILV